ncbi:DUF1761 domain-containing protein [Henriciella marina]|uniref:DUF1761 domain-containing protein n=1 Tax=Henriciella marina TaxID=453851 RepID=UPI00037191F6|nr:DUF1761 domain-containing protein [Henriciella marina]
MPRLAGVNLVGVLLAAIVIYLVGFVWYGLLFSEPYMNAVGIYFNEAGDAITYATSEGMQTRTMEDVELFWLLGGFVVPLFLAFGLGWHLRRKSITSASRAAGSAFALSLLIGVPLIAYPLIYTPWHDWTGFLVNASHTVACFVAGAVVLSFFD